MVIEHLKQVGITSLVVDVLVLRRNQIFNFISFELNICKLCVVVVTIQRIQC